MKGEKKQKISKIKNEDVYKEGKKLEDKKQYKEALVKYQEAEKKFLMAGFAHAKLFLEKKAVADNAVYSDLEYQQKAIEILTPLSRKNIPAKHSNHVELETIKKILKSNISYVEAGLEGKAKLILARLEQKPIDKIKIYIQAIQGGQQVAAEAIEELDKLLIEEKDNITFIQTLLAEILPLRETTTPNIARVLALVFRKFFDIKKNISDFCKPYGLATPKQALEILKKYDNANFIPDITRNYSLSLQLPFEFNWLKQAWEWYELNKIDSEELNQYCLVYFKNLAVTGEIPTVLADNAELIARIAQYFFRNGKYATAELLFRFSMQNLKPGITDFEQFKFDYEAVLRLTHNEAEISILHTMIARTQSMETNFSSAEKKLADWVENQNQQSLLDAIVCYGAAAAQLHEGALKKIDELCDQEIPEAFLEKIKLINVLEKEEKNREKIKSELLNSARKYYFKILENESRPDIYRIIASLRQKGEIFDKNPVLARDLYSKAVTKGDAKAAFPLAKMLFYGEGGEVDVTQAKKLLDKIKEKSNELSIEELELYSEIIYLEYLYAKDHPRDKLNKEDKLNDYTNLLTDGILRGSRKCLLSLFILFYYDKELQALELLDLLYNEKSVSLEGEQLPYEEFLKKYPVLYQVDFPGFPQDKGRYGILFAQLLKNKQFRIPEVPSQLSVEDQKKLQEFIASFNVKLKINVREISLEEIEFLENYAKLGSIEAKFALAKYQLIAKDKSLPLRNWPYFEYKEEVVDFLFDYYKNLPNNEGLFRLITAYLYELQLHAGEVIPNLLLRDVINKFNPDYVKYQAKDFKNYLEEIEQKNKHYYDEYISEDSDSDVEEGYHKADYKVTADYARSKELFTKIEPIALKALDKLLGLKDIDEEKYAKEVDYIKGLFSSAIIYQPGNITHDKKVEEDLATLNHFSARGEIEEALKLITTNFCVVQKRGLHFKNTLWSQPVRRDFRYLARDGKHPFNDKKVFSAAVYDWADIRDFNDRSEIVELRLEKIARYIHQQVMRLREAPPYDKSSSAKIPDSLYQYNFGNRDLQIQQLYSNEYDSFHQYIEWERQQIDSIFISSQNPNLSTGDLQSSHSERYAYGNKPYAGHEHERLRPKYQEDGRTIRPYSGAVLISFHPLVDFARNDHNHLVSLSMKGELFIKEQIIHERECTFYSFMEEDRLKFIHIARFPSFHHLKCPKTFPHKYGVTDKLYEKFKQLIIQTKPHEYKRRLTILLLGEYLCAYQTLYSNRYAYEKATEKLNSVLLYRDKYGNFSLKPTYDVSPTPHGDEDRNQLRRLYTNDLRQNQLKQNSAVSIIIPRKKKDRPWETPYSFFTSAYTETEGEQQQQTLTPKRQKLDEEYNPKDEIKDDITYRNVI